MVASPFTAIVGGCGWDAAGIEHERSSTAGLNAMTAIFMAIVSNSAFGR
jgi:hypothetical protein